MTTFSFCRPSRGPTSTTLTESTESFMSVRMKAEGRRQKAEVRTRSPTRHPESAKRDEGSPSARPHAISRSFAVFAAQDDVRSDFCLLPSYRYQIHARLHHLPFATIDCANHAIRMRDDRVLHLHRLENHQRCSVLHNISHLHQNFQDHAGHRRAGGVIVVARLHARGALVRV